MTQFGDDLIQAMREALDHAKGKGPVRTAALKVLPVLRNDAEVEDFVATADLSEHDLSGFKPMRLDSES